MSQTTPPEGSGNADPSMDDILASIRRILSDEEKAAKAKAPADGVFVLDPSMMVDDPAPAEASAEPEAPRDPLPEPTPIGPTPIGPKPIEPAPMEPTLIGAIGGGPPTCRTPAALPMAPEGTALVAPEAAAAAASSLTALMRTLVSERATAVSRGGPTLEDVVREEMRPLLKQWLDTHLPGLVERLVRAEIERVVGRGAG